MLTRKGEEATSSFYGERALKPIDVAVLFYSLNYGSSGLVHWQAVFSLFTIFLSKMSVFHTSVYKIHHLPTAEKSKLLQMLTSEVNVIM